MATPTTDVHNESLPTTSYISADTDSECQSSSACTPPETPVAPLRLSTANRSLLVRVLNRNLAQQQQDTGLQSLSSDPLLNALPAGETSKVLDHMRARQKHVASL